MEPLRLFVTAPKNLDDLLVAELSALGGAEVRAHRAGVEARGDLDFAYRVCLESRVAARVLLQIAEVHAADADARR